MLTRNYYLTVCNGGKTPVVTITPNPDLLTIRSKFEAREWEEVWVWEHPYPLWLGELIKDLIEVLILKQHRFDRGALRSRIRREAKKWGYSGKGKWVDVGEKPIDYGDSVIYPDFSLEAASAEDDLGKILPGRVLTLKEIRWGLNKKGRNLSPQALEALLQKHIIDGSLKLRAGVGPDRIGRFTCRRCGSINQVIRAYSYASPRPSWSCESCRSMGVITSSTPLFSWVGLRPSLRASKKVRLVLPELTKWQKRAAQDGMNFWEKKSNRILLIWAVCGAGKTEIVFPLIHRAITEGKRVLLTVPRREVVSELGKRVEKAFPGLDFSLLYGGKKSEPEEPRLTVATTHQLLRFHCQFDLAVLDEADAYPFNYEPMLAQALERSLLPDGKLVYMTATPDTAWRKRARRGRVDLIRIPLRHHGYPLPTPVLKKLKLPLLYRDSNSDFWLPPEIGDLLQRIISRGRRVLVFVPTVGLTERVGKCLKQPIINYGGVTDYIHSSDPLRDVKLKAFGEGKVTLLVTTTLLERGLTFPDLDVVVLYADMNKIFSSETLVQIAGRVGRSADSPDGEVIMIGRSISQEMREAKAWIEEMNREAQRLGFLNKG